MEKPLLLLAGTAGAEAEGLGRALSSDYRIALAADSEAALAVVQTDSPDMIVLDLTTAGFDGSSLGEALRSDPRGTGAPLIAIVAPRDATSRQRAAAAGALDTLAAPVDLDDARLRLRTYLELALARQAAQEVASLDSLTGLYNRPRFDRLLTWEWQQAARAGEALSLAFVEVDYLQTLNETLGSAAGDECLRRVAGTLREAVPPPMTAARYHGATFALLFPRTDSTGSTAAVEAVKHAITVAAIPNAGAPFGQASVSVGTATGHPAPGSAPEALIAEAERRLADARRQKRS